MTGCWTNEPFSLQEIVVPGFSKDDGTVVNGIVSYWRGGRYVHLRRMTTPSAESGLEYLDAFDNREPYLPAYRARELSHAARKLLKAPSTPGVVARISVGPASEIQVRLAQPQKYMYAVVQRFYMRHQEDDWQPSPAGIWLPAELIPELVSLCERLARAVTPALRQAPEATV